MTNHDGQYFLGKDVVTKWGTGDYRTTTPGRIIAYTDKPTVTIEYPDGSREDWIAGMVEVVCEHPHTRPFPSRIGVDSA